MNGGLLIFLLSLLVYVPLACVLLYVWWKYGKNEIGVSIARAVFIGGSVALIACMIIV